MPKATKVGVVTSNKMDKTAVVQVERLTRHSLYTRTYKKTSSFMVHDEKNQCRIGDRVRIVEARPLSRRKRWRLVEVLFSPAALEEEASQQAGAAD